MRILLINVDSRWNMAIRKLYNYYIKKGDGVEMIDLGFSAYPHKKTMVIDGSDYDKVFISNIFDMNKDKVSVINCDEVVYGGIGSNNPSLQLPQEIEMTEPYYYPDEDTTHTFITRGCIRGCWFCKVPKYEGKLKEYNSDWSKCIKHKKAIFYDNNIFAYDRHLELFEWLIDRDIRCDFNQGLDFRLANDENMSLLSQLRYLKTSYIFAFDEPKYQSLLDQKILMMKKYIPKKWKLQFYIYYHPDMSINQLISRAEWCRDKECLPYVMRDARCWECDTKDFLIDYASYCNTPSMFKNISFEEFLYKRYKNQKRIDYSLSIYKEYRK